MKIKSTPDIRSAFLLYCLYEVSNYSRKKYKIFRYLPCKSSATSPIFCYNHLMKNTREDILHLAKLSNLSLEESEIEGLQRDLDNIVGYISQLDELNTDGVEPTYQVFEMENIWREDEIKPQDATREELLNLAPAARQDMIQVPKVL